jgi:hypothetical protein
VLAFAPDGRRLASGSFDTTGLVWDVSGRLQDGRLREDALSPKRLEALWHDLARKDGAAAYRAVWALAADPLRSVPFLAGRLWPGAEDDKRVARWIADLADDRAEVRQQAHDGLIKLGVNSIPTLKRVLAGDPPEQVRARVENVLAVLAPVADEAERRTHRAVFVLEQAGTPAASALLQRLARGPANHPLTQEALRALQGLPR